MKRDLAITMFVAKKVMRLRDGGGGGGGGGGGEQEAVGGDCGGSVGIGIGGVDGDVGADSVGERVRDGGDGSVGAVCDGAFWAAL